MKINIIGGGPAGLYFAILMKQLDPGHTIVVVERNGPDDTYGWGIVFSGRSMSLLAERDPQSHAEIMRASQTWDSADTVHRGVRISMRGNTFSGIARITFLHILQQRCRDLGVTLQYDTAVTDVETLRDCDLLVGADGANSQVRQTYDMFFQPLVDLRQNRFTWLGTQQPFGGLTMIFRTPRLPNGDAGLFIAHAYTFSPTTSTFIVECPPATWLHSGLDHMSETETLAYLAGVFKDDLGGHALLSNNFLRWRNFPLIRNKHWYHANVVLLGDALHTAHFSIGSGTRLALEDAMALADAFSRNPSASVAATPGNLPRPIIASNSPAQLPNSLAAGNPAPADTSRVAANPLPSPVSTSATAVGNPAPADSSHIAGNPLPSPASSGTTAAGTAGHHHTSDATGQSDPDSSYSAAGNPVPTDASRVAANSLPPPASAAAAGDDSTRVASTTDSPPNAPQPASGVTVAAALADFERTRKPRVDEFQEAATTSLAWLENVSAYLHLDPVPFAFGLMTRSGRQGYHRIKRKDPEFIAQYDAWKQSQRPEGPIPDQFLELFSKRSLGHLSTLMADGTPHVTPVWVDYDGRHIIVNSAKGRLKDIAMSRRPHVAIEIGDPDNPNRYVLVRGDVVEISEEGADAHLDQLAQRYLSREAYPSSWRFPGEVRRTYKILPTHVTPWEPFG